jgi:hypothetical protein
MPYFLAYDLQVEFRRIINQQLSIAVSDQTTDRWIDFFQDGIAVCKLFISPVNHLDKKEFYQED